MSSEPGRAERIHGCLLGGALGDALGAPIEFLSVAEIHERFGPRGVETLAGGPSPGTITDDTQMTLFTAEGLLRSHNRRVANGSADVAESLYRAYLRWDYTQRAVWPTFAPVRQDTSGWLLSQAFLHQPRAPGRTCLSALRADRRGTTASPLNSSKGCGGVMRVAPIGLVADDAFGLAVEAAALTHGHPTGYLAAGAFAAIIAALARGASLAEGIDRSLAELALRPGHEETTAALRAAMEVSRQGASVDGVVSLGEGWIAEEALAIAVYCALTAVDFAAGVSLAVNHGGDSDSTGAITGHLLGTALGVSALPVEWLAALEGREVIARVADDLHQMTQQPDTVVDVVRYPV